MILYGYKVYKPYPNLNSYYFIAKLEMLIGEQTASVGMGNEIALSNRAFFRKYYFGGGKRGQ